MRKESPDAAAKLEGAIDVIYEFVMGLVDIVIGFAPYGVFAYIFGPKGKYYITKYGKIFAVGNSEQEMQQKMYEHYKAKYTFSY